MKIYITGISGFLSINLVRYLLAHGYTEISGIDLVDFTYPERDQIQFLQGDIRKEADLRKSMQDADVVIHTAAALPLYSPRRNLLHRCCRHASGATNRASIWS